MVSSVELGLAQESVVGLVGDLWARNSSLYHYCLFLHSLGQLQFQTSGNKSSHPYTLHPHHSLPDIHPVGMQKKEIHLWKGQMGETMEVRLY